MPSVYSGLVPRDPRARAAAIERARADVGRVVEAAMAAAQAWIDVGEVETLDLITVDAGPGCVARVRDDTEVATGHVIDGVLEDDEP